MIGVTGEITCWNSIRPPCRLKGIRLSVTHAGVRIGAVPTGASSMASPRCSCCQRKPEAEQRFLMRNRRSAGVRMARRDARREPALFRQRGDFTLLDQMARLKLNKFHWHLTDDQGWRIEIPCYPELTQEGAWRFSIGRTRCAWPRGAGTKRRFPASRPAAADRWRRHALRGYYTRKDIREVVAYAAVRGVST